MCIQARQHLLVLWWTVTFSCTVAWLIFIFWYFSRRKQPHWIRCIRVHWRRHVQNGALPLGFGIMARLQYIQCRRNNCACACALLSCLEHTTAPVLHTSVRKCWFIDWLTPLIVYQSSSVSGQIIQFEYFHLQGCFGFIFGDYLCIAVNWIFKTC